MKLKNAAEATAECGRSTRVDTTVAIEFAASCRPFKASKRSATEISATRANKLSAASTEHRSESLEQDESCYSHYTAQLFRLRTIFSEKRHPLFGIRDHALYVLDHDGADLVGNILEPVHD